MTRVLAVLTLLAAAPAAAQDADDAQEAFDEGVRALRMERYEEAAGSFRRAYELEPRAETACNLALTYDRWTGHKEDAIDTYLQCAQDDESGRFRDHALARASTLRSQRIPAAAEDLPAEGSDTAPAEAEPPDEAGDDGTTIPIVQHGTAPERSHALLFVGGGAAVVGLGLLIGGAIAAGNGREEVTLLEEAYPGGIITDANGAARLEDVEDMRRRALALYVSGGIVAAAGLALAAIDLARGSDDATVSLTPTRGGAFASLRLRLR